MGDYEPPQGQSDANDDESKTREPEVCLKNVVAKWTSESNEPTLNKISFNAAKGELLAIVGTVGSGKVMFIFLSQVI